MLKVDEVHKEVPGEIQVTQLIDRLPISGLQVRCILLCALVAILDGFDTQAIAFVAPAIAGEWSLPISAFGPIFAAGLVGLMIGAMALGPLADWLGRKSVIIAAAAVFGTGMLATAWAHDVASLMLLRFLTGLGLGGALPNIFALTAEYSPKRIRATLVSLMFIGFPAGAVLGGAISAQLIVHQGWQYVFYLGGVLPLILLPVLVVALPESLQFLIAKGKRGKSVARYLGRMDTSRRYTPDQAFAIDAAGAKGVPLHQLFTDGRLSGTLLIWILFFANFLPLYFLLNWLPSILREAGLPLERAIAGTVLLNLGGVAGGLVLSYLVDRGYNMPRTLLVSYFLAAISIAVIGQVGMSVLALMVAVVIAGFFVAGIQFCLNAVAAIYYPTQIRSTGCGWANGIGRLGAITGPVIGGMLLSLGLSTSTLFLAAAIPALVSAVAVMLIRTDLTR